MATGRAASKARRARSKAQKSGSWNNSRSKNSDGSKQIGLNLKQVSQLASMDGIDKKALKSYTDSGSAVGGRNNPTGRGRSTREKAIRADQIGEFETPVIPEPPRPDNVGDMLGMNNASVLQEGLTLQGGQFVPDPTASDQMNATREANMNMGNVANSILGYLKPEANQMERAYEDTYGISSREAGRDFRNAQQEVQQYTSQLNTLTASRDAEMLKLEGQGRGQTSGFIGGEQARINREAAIQALPVQAQLAAAQGNLEMAKSHVDSLFQMKLKDIDTQQAYKQTVANTFMSVATAQQQNLLNAAIADSNAKAEAKKIAMNDAKSIAMQAIEYGQSSLARSVMSLDPTSPTYQEDVLKMMGQLSKPVAAVAPAKRDTSFDKFGNLVDMQTGEVIRYADDVAPGDGGYTPEQIVQQKADALSAQIKDITTLKTHPGMKATVGAYGFNPFGDGRTSLFTADKSEQKDFIAGVEQLISQKFLDSLIDTKAKGGSFGALTKPEQDALTVAATKIGNWRIYDGDGEKAKVKGYEIGEKEFQTELDTLITLAQKAESMARGYDVTLVGADDSETIDNIFRAYQAASFSPSNYYTQ